MLQKHGVPVKCPAGPPAPLKTLDRSEEHTSELQSRSDLVCRLLLEKKIRPLLYVDVGAFVCSERLEVVLITNRRCVTYAPQPIAGAVAFREHHYPAHELSTREVPST